MEEEQGQEQETGRMGDREAREARRRKLQLLEKSLFGGDTDSNVALPQVSAILNYGHVET